MTTFEFHAPDLTEVNTAMTKAFSHIQGLRMYSEAEIRDIKAQAFDEGFTSCASEHTKQ